MKLNKLALWLVVILTIIWVAAIYSGFSVYDFISSNSKKSPGDKQLVFVTGLYTDFVRYLLQFTFISIAGAILVKEYEHARSRRQAIKEFRQHTGKLLVDTYLTVKRARWDLRAAHRNGEIEFIVYQASITKLVELKSQIEALEFGIAGAHDTFTLKERQQLLTNLGWMEKYVDSIVDECAEGARGTDKIVIVSKFIKLNDFLRKRDKDKNEAKEETPFGKGYRIPVKQAIAVLGTSKEIEIFGFTRKLHDLYISRRNRAASTSPHRVKAGS